MNFHKLRISKDVLDIYIDLMKVQISIASLIIVGLFFKSESIISTKLSMVAAGSASLSILFAIFTFAGFIDLRKDSREYYSNKLTTGVFYLGWAFFIFSLVCLTASIFGIEI